MKTIISIKSLSILLSICILFQNCYSYKSIKSTEEELELAKFYKVELKDSRELKGRIIKNSNNSIELVSKKNKTTIVKEDISSIKKRKFSYLKTIGTYLVIGTILTFIAIDNLNFNGLFK